MAAAVIAAANVAVVPAIAVVAAVVVVGAQTGCHPQRRRRIWPNVDFEREEHRDPYSRRNTVVITVTNYYCLFVTLHCYA